MLVSHPTILFSYAAASSIHRHSISSSNFIAKTRLKKQDPVGQSCIQGTCFVNIMGDLRWFDPDYDPHKDLGDWILFSEI